VSSPRNAGTLQSACSGIVIASCGLMVITGLRLAPQAMLAPWHTALIIVGTLLLALTKIKPVWIIAVAAVLGFVNAGRLRGTLLRLSGISWAAGFEERSLKLKKSNETGSRKIVLDKSSI
jgi:chromate transport protein ChrA